MTYRRGNAPPVQDTRAASRRSFTETPMLIPIADVPRWYAERKHKDAGAISHGADTLPWQQLERPANRRARAPARGGPRSGDSVALGRPNGNAFSQPTSAV